jgi:hypothetical protein
MPCANCGEAAIKAHLIPQAFIREVRGEDKGHALTNRDISSFQPSQNGRYDDAILCSACDNALGKHEKYAFETLAAIRTAAPDIVDRAFMVDGVDGDRLLRFAAGIVWKYALTKRDYGRIEIGPYTRRLQQMLFEDSPPQLEIDAFLMKLHSGDDMAYFYRAPSPERYEGLNFIRFSVGGFIFLVKLDQRKVSSLPKAAWLRGSSSLLIPALAFDRIEEGRMFLGARDGNERLDAYLDRLSLTPTMQ